MSDGDFQAFHVGLVTCTGDMASTPAGTWMPYTYTYTYIYALTYCIQTVSLWLADSYVGHFLDRLSEGFGRSERR